MTYTPTKLDEALELEIKAAGLRVQHMMSIGEMALAKGWERCMARLIADRSPEYVRHLEETRGLV